MVHDVISSFLLFLDILEIYMKLNMCINIKMCKYKNTNANVFAFKKITVFYFKSLKAHKKL